MRYSTPSLPGPGLPPVTAKLYEHINFGYSVLSSHIGMGISTSAATALVEYCREGLESDTIGPVSQIFFPAWSCIKIASFALLIG